MALRVEQHGDVTRLCMDSIGSRVAGMDVSSYVVRGVIIDAGFPRAHAAFAGAVKRLGVRGAYITHWHEDHAGNVAALADLGIPVGMRSDTESILRRAPEVPFYRRVVWGAPLALTGTVTPFGDESFECVHTPGHSPDHQVVWDTSTGTLFSGDLWLGVRARVLHSAEDPYAIIESLRTARALSPARMFDAHRGCVDDPVTALSAKIDWLGTTLETIESRVRAGASDRAIVREVLGGEERSAYVSFGDYSRRNLVSAVRARVAP
jgi:endoribonuclease LACTB2